jgi:hypothetical protein
MQLGGSRKPRRASASWRRPGGGKMQMADPGGNWIVVNDE